MAIGYRHRDCNWLGLQATSGWRIVRAEKICSAPARDQNLPSECLDPRTQKTRLTTHPWQKKMQREMDQTTNNDQDNDCQLCQKLSFTWPDGIAVWAGSTAITERNYVLRGGFFLSNLSRTPQSSPLLVNKIERLRIGLLCYSWTQLAINI